MPEYGCSANTACSRTWSSATAERSSGRWRSARPSRRSSRGADAPASHPRLQSTPQPRRMSLSAGDRLGPYTIIAALGAGGMGEVYAARDTRLERDVAIKVLPPGLTGSDPARERLQREARAIAALQH